MVSVNSLKLLECLEISEGELDRESLDIFLTSCPSLR